MYKLNEQSIKRLSDNASIPQAEGNIDYQQFLQDVKEHTISIVEGADVVEPDYVALRTGAEGYASTGDQFGMLTDGKDIWDAHVAEVKAKFPKTITGGITIADIPDWVEVEVAKVLFSEQLQAYTAAVARLEKYVLSDGREEVTEMQYTTEYELDDNHMIILTDDKPTYKQEEVIVVSSVDPLEPTIKITVYSEEDIDAEPTIKIIENPLITQDNLERLDAQAVVDVTPPEVKVEWEIN
jgi:hypothetical protein